MTTNPGTTGERDDHVTIYSKGPADVHAKEQPATEQPSVRDAQGRQEEDAEMLRKLKAAGEGLHEMADLVPLIYHERQEQGTMSCAMHALNSLLGDAYFTEADLAGYAQDLDERENAELGAAAQHVESQNMDETGFFSVGVLEEALKVWGLELVRWRSNELRREQSHPEDQAAFILNLASHWFTLRRFGDSPQRWYDLNSFKERPEWVGPMYLDSLLQQSEAEGYSVFVVRQLTPPGPAKLPITEVDEAVASLPAPGGGGAFFASTRVHDDDDLQAAIRASLAGSSSFSSVGADDPVARAAERNRAYLASVAREQEAELRGAGAEADRRRVREEEEMRRAVEASLREERERERRRGGAGEGREVISLDDDEDEEMDFGAEEEEEEEDIEWPDDDAAFSSPAPALAPALVPSPPPAIPSSSSRPRPRVLDDEDAELQAALRASLADVPPEFEFQRPPSPRPVRSRASAGAKEVVELDGDDEGGKGKGEGKKEGGGGQGEEEEADVEREQMEVTPEQMRAARLARFGM